MSKGQFRQGKPAPPGLSIVATPIGNAGDITLRALETLAQVDLIACEDTRTTGALMARYGIGTRRVAYNDRNAERVRPRLIERLRAGARIALVSDAGTPLVSDPGYKLVSEALAEDLPVTALPGASAVIAGIAVSGLPTDRFLFAGFLPAKSAARQRFLAELAAVPATLVLFEAARRLPESLAAMAAALGDRPAAVARELTKLHEEVRRGGLAELAAQYADAGPPRGEVVVIIGGRPMAVGQAEEVAPEAGLDNRLRAALAGASLRDAVAAVAAAMGLPRRIVYARALALAAERGRR